MPEISRFFGIVVRMFDDELDPPHIQTEFQGHVALIDFSGNIMRGDLGSRTATRLVREWMSLHVEELRVDWTLAQAGRELQKITPLD
jgi:hypothetical protein